MKNIIIQLFLFCCMITNVFAQNKIKQYEYWLDNDFLKKQVVSITPTVNFELTTIPANTLMKPGLHTVNIRFQDTNGKYSSVITQLVEAFTLNPQILSLEYWFDEAYNTKTVIPLTASSVITVNVIDVSTVSNGMHTFNIRFLDRAAKWSAVQTARIYKFKSGSMLNNTITAYRYWIDNDFANNIYKVINPSLVCVSLNETIDLSSFKGNNRLLNVQIKDALGMWSSVITDTVNVSLNSGLDDKFASGDFRTYPNPCRGMLTIEVNRTISDASVSITNAIGKVIYQNHFDIVNKKSLNINELQTGIYFLRIVEPNNANKLTVQKVILQN